MRLTLRTMLAYLDDILEPNDAEEIGRKIEESEFANGLVHRIRGCIRRLRLPAPSLEGQGMGLDSNTVAEYLDNTLPPERVADFEKVCLESDVHLAEVGACHQILTLVLGEPASVPASSRDRVYRILAEGQTQPGIDPPQPDTVPAPRSAVAAADPASVKPARKKPEIPDYLRDPPRRRTWPIVATGLVAAALTAVVLWTLGPFDAAHPVLGFLFSAPRLADRPVQAPAPGAHAATEHALSEPDVKADLPPALAIESTSPTPLPSPAAAVGDLGPPPADSEDNAQNKVGQTDGDGAVDAEQSREATEVALVEPANPAAEPGITAPLEGEPNIEPKEDLGHFTSENQVLVRLDSVSGAWQRLAPRSALGADDILLALPTFRPQILTMGIHLTLDGGTRFQLKSLDSTTPLVHIEYGRALILAPNRAGSQAGLILAGQRGIVRFFDTESTVAVEVRREHTPGRNPLTSLAHETVRLVGTTGRIDWEPAEGPVQTLRAGQAITFFNDETGQAEELAGFPAWTANADLIQVDRLASSSLNPLLTTSDRPIGLRLSELNDHRRVEVRQLAARCLCHLGQFDTCVEALDDETQKPYWYLHILALQAGLARSPESAQQVLSSFEKLRGAEAEALFRLLWGYSPEDLRNGQAEQLVEYLDNDRLDYRVLAYENLKSITKTTTLYRPYYNKKRRGPLVKRWREDLRKGLIVYKNPPPDLPPRQVPIPPDEAPDSDAAVQQPDPAADFTVEDSEP